MVVDDEDVVVDDDDDDVVLVRAVRLLDGVDRLSPDELQAAMSSAPIATHTTVRRRVAVRPQRAGGG